MNAAVEESRKLRKQVAQLKGTVAKLESNERRMRTAAAEREKEYEKERTELKRKIQQKRTELDEAVRKKDEFENKKSKILIELLRKDERIYFLQEKLKQHRIELKEYKRSSTPGSHQSPQERTRGDTSEEPRRSDCLSLSGNYKFGLAPYSGRLSHATPANLDPELEFLNRLLEMVSRYECLGCTKLFTKDSFPEHFEKCCSVRCSQITAQSSITGLVPGERKRYSDDALEANFHNIDEFEMQLEEEIAEISQTANERSRTLARKYGTTTDVASSSSVRKSSANMRLGSPVMPNAVASKALQPGDHQSTQNLHEVTQTYCLKGNANVGVVREKGRVMRLSADLSLAADPAGGERNVLLKTETKNLLNRLLRLRGKMSTIQGDEEEESAKPKLATQQILDNNGVFKKCGSNNDLVSLRQPQHAHGNSITGPFVPEGEGDVSRFR